MLLRPDADDLRLILLYLGRVVTGVGLLMLLPAVYAFTVDEPGDGWSFLLACGVTTTIGQVGELLRPRRALRASHALAVVAAIWIVVPFFGAMPLAMSGHWATYVDAYFESVSGFTSNGLSLALDIDHMPRSVNLWRHLIQVIGGQGSLVLVLAAFASGSARLGTLYAGGGREDVIIPNVRRAARFAGRVAAVYALVGIPLLWALLRRSGVGAADSGLHAVALFASAFDTGGFSLQSSSVAAYRSPAIEAVVLVLMVAGAFSYALHAHLWQRRRAELWRSTEARTITASVLLLLMVMTVGLVRSGTFEGFLPLYRHALFQIVSAHTTTGLSTVPGRVLLTDWGVLAPAALVTAMGIGGMASSTAGGVKGIRLGVILKGLRGDVRRVLLPQDAVVVETYHDGTRQILGSAQVRDAAVLLFLWLSLYLGGAVVGLFHGYDLASSLFESTAAAASAGFSIGVVEPGMPGLLKAVYLSQMLVGRLEFIALFALAGYALSIVRGRA